MKRKKILILCSNMNIGGFQRSLISLLQCFDYEKYDVDLLLADADGILTKYIPNQVNLLEPVISSDYYAPFPGCIIALIKQGHFIQVCYRIVGAIMSLFNKGLGFVISNKAIPKIATEYDVAIDYNGQQQLYFMVDRIKADKKISYFHSDYNKWPYYKKMDQRYYKKVDAIVTVSDECVSSMKKIFPEYKDKIYRIENIISSKTVRIFQDTPSFNDENVGIRIITVGRVCFEKGIDYTIEVCKLLKSRDCKFKWYWVGPYEKNSEWVKKAKEEISDVFILLGPTDNPYGYMKQADILVHPSRFEGKSVTVEEAKILNLPIVVTNYSTVYDQIDDGRTGIIVDMNPVSIADGIYDLIEHPEKRKIIKKYMKECCQGNEDEVKILYKIIES